MPTNEELQEAYDEVSRGNSVPDLIFFEGVVITPNGIYDSYTKLPVSEEKAREIKTKVLRSAN